MPIQPLVIEDDLLDQVALGPKYTPKDFHKDVTGTGGGRGRIDVAVHPANPDLSYDPIPKVDAPTKEQIDGETSVRTLVTQPLLEMHLEEALRRVYTVDVERSRVGQSAAELEATPYLYRFPVPPTIHFEEVKKLKKVSVRQVQNMFDVSAALGNGVAGYRLWLNLEPQLVVLRDRGVMDASTGKNVWTKTTHIRYRIELFAIAEAQHTDELYDVDGVTALLDGDGNPITAPSISQVAAVTDVNLYDPLQFEGVDSFVQIAYSFNVPETLAEMIDSTVAYLVGRSVAVPAFDKKAFMSWSLDHYSVYERLCSAAEVFQTELIVEPILTYVTRLYAALHWFAGVHGTTVEITDMDPAGRQLGFLDNFATPLEAYTAIYTGLLALDNSGPVSAALISRNMQLKQNAELQRLNAVKHLLPVPGPVDPARYTIPDYASIQQRAAVETTDPLVMVVAGAGAGKTWTITERIRMLTLGCSVVPSSILALSFTNAAADEIRDRNPGIESKTIARMIHEIYTHNFADQELSTMETIQNSLGIYFGPKVETDPVLSEFHRLVGKSIVKETNADIIAMSAFIERYTSEVVTILNTIGQTTLELEIILSYLLIDKLVEPYPSPAYLIIDEVQDNSAFQFVYAMRYAAKHQCSLYMVGDASQTLYEFRAANPKALSALEASGVFTVCKLSTNYRSAQEILDFANIHLSDIEANRFTKIQLQANSVNASTADSFTKSVRLISKSCGTQRAFDQNLKQYFRGDELKKYFTDNLAARETTVVLCQTRRHAKMAQEVLVELFPDEAVHNLVSDRAYSMKTFSTFIARYWDQVTCVEPAVAPFTFHQQIRLQIGSLEPRNTEVAERILDDALVDWWRETNSVCQAWLQMVASGMMTDADFFLHLRKSILDYEIRNNAIRNSLTGQKNAVRKEEMAARDPKLMVSTVHGVKGMEFDHVVVVLQPETSSTRKDESYKRLLYVALTRAKIDEVILAGVSTAKPRIETDYEAVVEALRRREIEDAAASDDQSIDIVEVPEGAVADTVDPTPDAGDVVDQINAIGAEVGLDTRTPVSVSAAHGDDGGAPY
ncbi:ATP-dependent helicase [Gordonia sp. GAMMA]|uniref:UvrD-helicase domain-containing protein n=1 Tax=Gordonia sp. GAMMA TaxID=2502241 RepID=UPI0010F89C0E|nr:ATP-dependent helicase [Gordonia sp. GAMMA]